jgi:hypothetical protein
MNNIALSESAVREELFRATAQQTKLSPAIVEKDFWISMPSNLKASRSASTLAIRKPSCFPIHRPSPMMHCCRKYG